MGNFTRRAVAFLLGMVFAVVFTVAGIAGGAYWAFKNVPLKNTGAVKDDTLGNLTTEELIALMVKAGSDEYTFEKLKEEGVDVLSIIKQFGVKFDEESEDYKSLEGLSPALLFSKNGLDELNFGAVFAFISQKNGVYPVFSSHIREELRNKSFGKAISKDKSGRLNIYSELRNFKVGAVLSSLFEERFDAALNDYVYSFITNENNFKSEYSLNLLGNVKFSVVTDYLDKSKEKFDIYDELNDGNLKDVGNAELKEFIASLAGLGGEESYINTKENLSSLDDMLVKELFEKNEDGSASFSIEKLLAKIKIGNLLGYKYCSGSNDADCPVHDGGVGCKEGWYAENGGEYTPLSSVTAQDQIMLNLVKRSVGDLMNMGSGGDFRLADIAEGVYLGSMLGYEKVTPSGETGYCSPDCGVTGEGHKHNYLWQKGGKKATEFFNRLSNLSFVSALNGEGLDIEGIINDLYVGEFLGYKKEGGVWMKDGVPAPEADVSGKVMANLYDYKITDLTNGFNIAGAMKGVYFGDVLGYSKGEIIESACEEGCPEAHTHIKTDKFRWSKGGVDVEAIYNNLANIEISTLINGETEFNLDDILADSYVGELMGYTRDGSSWKDGGGNAVSELNAMIADIKMSEILDGTLDLKSKADNLKISSLITIEESSPEFLKTIKNKKISELSAPDFINGLKIGEIMTVNAASPSILRKLSGYMIADLNKQETFDNIKVNEIVDTAGSAVLTRLGEKTLNDLKSANAFNDIKISDFIPDTSSSKILNALKDKTIGNLSDPATFNNLKISQLTEIPENNKILCALQDSTVGSLAENVNNLKLGDVVATSGSTVLTALENTKITELTSSINAMKFGTVMGYDLIDGVWKKEGVAISGVNAKIADYTIESFSQNGFDVNDFTLGDFGVNTSVGIFGILDFDPAIGETSKDDIPVADVAGRVNIAFQNKTIGELINANVLPISSQAQTKFDSNPVMNGWRESTIEAFFDKIASVM